MWLVTGLVLLAWPCVGGAQPASAVTRAAGTGAGVSAKTGPTTDPLLGALSLNSSNEPISVTAETLEFDNRTRVLTYKGDVVATQGDMKLESHTLTVALDDQADTRLKEIVATGDVRLSKGTRWATAGQAVFDQTKRTVVLSDNAVLHDGPNQVSGERVVVYLDQERSVVEGGNNGRVKAVLYPPKGGAATPAPADATAEATSANAPTAGDARAGDTPP